MTLEEINNAIRTALEAVRVEPSGHLLQPHRTALYRSMGPFRDPDLPQSALPAGQERRARLFVQAARRVLPVYNRILPGEQDVQAVIDLADAYLQGKASVQKCNEALRPLHSKIIGMPGEGEWILPAMYVAECAADALATAVGDCDHYVQGGYLDSEIDRWDAGFNAAAASALGDVWEPANELEVAAIRNYWTWFITEAFPAACRAVPG